MARLFTWAITGTAAVALLSISAIADEVVLDSYAPPAKAENPEAPAAKCTDAKCPACEAGTCTDANCAVKACAEGKCEDTATASSTAATCPACEAGTCTGTNCPLQAKATSAAATQVASSAAGEARLATPTHRQTKIIKANQEGLSKTKLNCFVMTQDGRLLAGCGTSKSNGEIRVFNASGEYVETWSTPCKVEAVNVRASDGMVFVAGDGILAKLDASGNLITEKKSPHATVSKEQAAKMREAVVKQMTQRVDMYRQQAKIYDQQIELIGGQIDKLTTKLDERDEDGDDDVVVDRQRTMIEQQVAQLERSKTSLERTQKLWNERIEQLGDAEPSDEDIDRQLQSQVARKMAVASISAVGNKVYVACSEAVGYGYCVWAVDDEFEQGEEIVGDLRGCCGQMDVQANAKGIYVAENSRDRVVCYDHQGEEVTHWGHSAREGIRGFGSCCNPMNVAFGPSETVYTAESGTGRIKQYSHDGQLLQVVGSADLVPGCKKVSIGVSSDGSRVFMLDITRDHIVMMDAIPADEREEMVAKAAAGGDATETEESEEEGQASEQAAAEAPPQSRSTASALVRVLSSPFRIGD